MLYVSYIGTLHHFGTHFSRFLRFSLEVFFRFFLHSSMAAHGKLKEGPLETDEQATPIYYT